MAFSSSSLTLAEPAPRHPYQRSDYEDPFSGTGTEGSRTPTKAPPTPSYTYTDSSSSTTAYSGMGKGPPSPSLATGVAQDNTHLLPTTNRKEKRYLPLALRLPIVFGVPFSLLLLAIGLEVGIVISEKHNGFSVPEKNVISFASAQFLLSFVPTMIVIPPAWVYRELDWHVRWYQPFVMMSQGNAKPQESVLLNYVTLGPLRSLINSAKFKHRVITWSALTALSTYILQPLAGSMFQLQNMPTPTNTTVTSIRAIGQADFSDLTAFVAAAGFAEAAVFNNLPEPPFIEDSWTVAQFDFPSKDYLNGTLTVDTVAIQTNTNCQGPDGTPSVTQTGINSVTISSTSVDGCTQTVELNNTNLASQQYGVIAESCSTVNITQSPVMFWFFHHTADGTAEAATVFCKPTLQAFNVQVTANLNNNSVSGVNELNSNVPSNNVTGPLSNDPFNGVVFENQTDPFVQARATATTNGVPGAIFRSASQLPGGIDAVFKTANPFLDLTNSVYTLYLALVTQSIYFVPQNSTLPAQLSSINLRLTINPLPGHALAFFLFFIGFVGVFIHIISRRQRRGLYLPTAPGTIASTIAMTAHSGFGELLMPTDDEDALERKLSDLRFSIDKRTGAIVATADVSLDPKRMSKKAEQDEMLQSLLGPEHTRPTSEIGSGVDTAASSSQVAFEAARLSYPPMKSPSSSRY
ncbi:hypothetical protein F5878DRAFT_620584 [Lentinula raphanica]|uniref:Uncharacterized protein n=1 Tax=Lentinula raphanica TaxID=153919 RepID=A0AA38UDP2_9AGAR|nr:hypothetical protein F5880DRAFT_858882 [Lentinula raphanica]KAJ3838062.1 hypothetical protein F5878DRAFT_620584 [Lentinula raphanica]